jgi:hypothetical protein
VIQPGVDDDLEVVDSGPELRCFCLVGCMMFFKAISLSHPLSLSVGILFSVLGLFFGMRVKCKDE